MNAIQRKFVNFINLGKISDKKIKFGVDLQSGKQILLQVDSSFFIQEKLLNEIDKHLLDKYAGQKRRGETEEQFLYKTRKRAFGDFKKEMWNLPEENLGGIREELERRFSLLFRKLNVVNTTDLIGRFVSVK